MRLSFLPSYVRQSLSLPTALRLVPISIVLVAGVVLTTLTHRILDDHRDLVVHTHEVIETTKDVLIGLDDAETGQRGYLLSGDRRYLEPYVRALERLATLQATLRAQISDNDDQLALAERLEGLIALKLGELKASIELHDGEGFEAARRREIAMMERGTMDTIRREIGAITEGEKALLRRRDTQVEEAERWVRLVAILVGLASVLTRAGVEFYLTRRGLDVRVVAPDGTPLPRPPA